MRHLHSPILLVWFLMGYVEKNLLNNNLIFFDKQFVLWTLYTRMYRCTLWDNTSNILGVWLKWYMWILKWQLMTYVTDVIIQINTCQYILVPREMFHEIFFLQNLSDRRICEYCVTEQMIINEWEREREKEIRKRYGERDQRERKRERER